MLTNKSLLFFTAMLIKPNSQNGVLGDDELTRLCYYWILLYFLKNPTLAPKCPNTSNFRATDDFLATSLVF